MNKIPAGYKKTEVGVIPDDWKVCQIADFQPFVTSGSRGWAKFYSDKGSIFVRITNLSRDSIYIDINNLKFVNIPIESSEGIRTKLQENDLLISITADIGIIGFVDSRLESPAYINQHIAMVRFDSPDVHSKFVAYFLASEIPQKLFLASVDLGAKAGMNLSSVNRLRFALPNIAEQEAIATALNDADALITQLEKLIAKKRLIKQGAMQQLLKPQPGWQTKKLGEIADVVGGGTPSTFKSSYWNGNINWFTPTEIGDKKYSYQSIRKITQEGFANSSAKLLSPGTILLTSRASIGDVSILMTEGCTNQGFQSLVAKESVDTEFLYYVALTLKPILQQNASGSTFLEISPKKLKAINIKIPDKSQQISISQALSDIDKEIDALEAKLAKYKQIKQGMMQSLLTGKVRLL